MTTLSDRTTTYGLRSDWLQARKDGIGASEVAAALGLSTFQDATPFSVWAKKQPDFDPLAGEDDQPPHLEWGHRLERAILERYQDDHHRDWLVESPGYSMTTHPELPWLFGTPDGICWRGAGGSSLPSVGGVDAKTSRSWLKHKWGEPGSGEVPTDYAFQAIVYMSIFDVPWWDFAVLFSGIDYAEYRVERDPETERRVLSLIADWHERHIVGGERPSLDASAAARAYADAKPFDDGQPMRVAEERHLELQRQYRAAAADLKDAKARQEAARNRLIDECNGAPGIEGVCVYRPGKGGKRRFRAL